MVREGGSESFPLFFRKGEVDRGGWNGPKLCKNDVDAAKMAAAAAGDRPGTADGQSAGKRRKIRIGPGEQRPAVGHRGKAEGRQAAFPRGFGVATAERSGAVHPGQADRVGAVAAKKRFAAVQKPGAGGAGVPAVFPVGGLRRGDGGAQGFYRVGTDGDFGKRADAAVGAARGVQPVQADHKMEEASGPQAGEKPVRAVGAAGVVRRKERRDGARGTVLPFFCINFKKIRQKGLVFSKIMSIKIYDGSLNEVDCRELLLLISRFPWITTVDFLIPLFFVKGGILVFLQP